MAVTYFIFLFIWIHLLLSKMSSKMEKKNISQESLIECNFICNINKRWRILWWYMELLLHFNFCFLSSFTYKIDWPMLYWWYKIASVQELIPEELQSKQNINKINLRIKYQFINNFDYIFFQLKTIKLTYRK